VVRRPLVRGSAAKRATQCQTETNKLLPRGQFLVSSGWRFLVSLGDANRKHDFEDLTSLPTAISSCGRCRLLCAGTEPIQLDKAP
jgi:hypothetical protein